MFYRTSPKHCVAMQRTAVRRKGIIVHDAHGQAGCAHSINLLDPQSVGCGRALLDGACGRVVRTGQSNGPVEGHTRKVIIGRRRDERGCGAGGERVQDAGAGAGGYLAWAGQVLPGTAVRDSNALWSGRPVRNGDPGTAVNWPLLSTLNTCTPG